jgi:hypothetical protein
MFDRDLSGLVGNANQMQLTEYSRNIVGGYRGLNAQQSNKYSTPFSTNKVTSSSPLMQQQMNQRQARFSSKVIDIYIYIYIYVKITNLENSVE